MALDQPVTHSQGWKLYTPGNVGKKSHPGGWGTMCNTKRHFSAFLAATRSRLFPQSLLCVTQVALATTVNLLPEQLRQPRVGALVED
jgi:hypothetical protein